MEKGTKWFKRFKKECESFSPHVRFREIKLGFYRIYYKGFYIGEAYKEMPPKGYDRTEEDQRLESQKYYEEYEDNVQSTRELKNFVEGYFESIDQFKTRMYMLRHDDEFYRNSRDAYKNVYIK
jgi:hypothetical protein